jgi:hypothetical protein
MRSYWKRISIYYKDLTRYKIDGDVLNNIYNVSFYPSFKVD